jgi:hypothetical protein
LIAMVSFSNSSWCGPTGRTSSYYHIIADHFADHLPIIIRYYHIKKMP